MMQIAKEVEENNPDGCVYIIRCERDYNTPELYNWSQYHNNHRSPASYLERLEDENLTVDQSAYVQGYSNCVKYEDLESRHEFFEFCGDYLVTGKIKFDRCIIPTWTLLSFFATDKIFYVGKSSGKNICDRIRSHKNSKTHFFRIHNPTSLDEVWELNYRENENNFGSVFYSTTTRASKVESLVRSELEERLEMPRRQSLVYSN